MNKMTRAALALSLIALSWGAAPAWSYNDDTHYPFMYFMARACGYTPLQAYRLASACLSIDYAAETEAEQYHRVIPSSQDAQGPRVDFHAFMDSRKYPDCLSDARQTQAALEDILKRRELFWEIAKKSGNIGHFLHFVQDETAHSGYGSWGGHYASYGAYKNFKPLGSTCDFLSYGPPERHYEMINLMLEFLAAFLREPQLESGDKPLQKGRSPNRGREILPLLTALREANPATEPLGATDALLVGAAWAIGGPLGGTAVAVLDGWKAKRGPIMEKADRAVEKALQAWGEIPTWKSGSRVFEDEPILYDFDKGGHPRGDADLWVLFGDLKVKLSGPFDKSGAQIVIRASKTRTGDQDEELARKTIKGPADPVVFRMLPVGNLIAEVSSAGRTVSRTLTLDKLDNEISITLPQPAAPPAPHAPKIVVLSAAVDPPEGKPGTFQLAVTYQVINGGSSDPWSLRKSRSITGPEPMTFNDEFVTISDDDRYIARFEHFFSSPGDYHWNFKLEIAGFPPAEGKVPLRVTEMVYVLKQGSPQLNRTRVGLKSETGSRAGLWELREDELKAASYVHRFQREQAGRLKSDLQFSYAFALPNVIVPSKGFSAAVAGKLTGRQDGAEIGDSCRLRLAYASLDLEPQAAEGDDLFLGSRTGGPVLNAKRNTRFRVLRKDAPTLTVEIYRVDLHDWPIATWTYELKWMPSSQLSALLGQNPPPLLGGGGGLTAMPASFDAGAREKELRDQLGREPENADSHNRLGNLLFNQKKYKEAEAEYRRAADRDIEKGLYHANLAGALLRQNRRDEALPEVQKARLLGETEHWAVKELGEISQSPGLLDPDELKKSRQARHLAAEAGDLLDQKDYAGAESKYRQAVGLSPSGTNYALLALALGPQKKWPEAEEALRLALKEEPAKAVWRANLAFALFSQGRREEALAEAREAARLGLKSHPVFKSLGLER